ncbi:MAG: hypothetical protein A2648_02050 [Candidatus Lloydbacteria bacterium RIFCSPHIGHO2_01_FULL_41_20]|uniref:CusB-like beta-barrel domain-containing protein n=1 Tax=Candidatus Lloydbacteria bacterium RIFCSPHIGHO2_01_FULL_41_20 TaxID=1798657 RepID=A0A1G2CQQ0_9BACT|nr:MAG: hypothetical protein A2648_02050 [Candidatus Lloydbacteria bacterium RIFCSPHIGHO2_01_FULL_41_20]
MNKIISFLQKKTVVYAFVAMFITVGGFLYFSASQKDSSEFVVVRRGEISQVVGVTGKVEPVEQVLLSFERSGRIATVYHQTGDRVYIGTPIVILENGDLYAELSQAKANVKAEQAKLDEMKRGTREEDIQISQIEVQNATYDVINDIKNSYVTADDSIRNKVDQFFSNPKTPSPQFNFSLTNSQLKMDIEAGRVGIESILNSWSVLLTNLSISSLSAQIITQYSQEAKNNLRAVQTYLDKIAAAINSLSANSSLSQTTIDTYKASVAAARADLTAALGGLTASDEKFRNASSKLALKVAGTAKEQIDAQEATVEAAQAKVMNINAQLAKTIIRAPISGVVTREDAKVGEIATIGVSLVAVISDTKYEIKAYVPEADIAKIKISDKAEITLDAYGNDVRFEGVVTKIDPAETTIENVSTYKVTLLFTKDDQRIKSGMTANIDIIGERRENAIVLSGRLIATKENIKTVTLVDGAGIFREVIVTTGLRGSNGDVEILSGLREGDKIKVE